MRTIFLVGERSEPLSRVFNDQPSGIYIIGERAKRARRYLVMSMESRDICNSYAMVERDYR